MRARSRTHVSVFPFVKHYCLPVISAERALRPATFIWPKWRITKKTSMYDWANALLAFSSQRWNTAIYAMNNFIRGIPIENNKFCSHHTHTLTDICLYLLLEYNFQIFSVVYYCDSALRLRFTWQQLPCLALYSSEIKIFSEQEAQWQRWQFNGFLVIKFLWFTAQRVICMDSKRSLLFMQMLPNIEEDIRTHFPNCHYYWKLQMANNST